MVITNILGYLLLQQILLIITFFYPDEKASKIH